MSETKRILLSGNEAVALAARDGGVALGAGYPGTPSTEILEEFSRLIAANGKKPPTHTPRAQWAPNEKVALEVALGAAFGGARALATMKHVGLNVAADVLFTAAYTGVTGALVVVSADDPGMASSQNEQDNRRYAVAAGVPMLEPADSQEAYDFTLRAIEISERMGLPVLLRITTRVCHSKTIVTVRDLPAPPIPPTYKRDIKGRVMIPLHARPAHRRLRGKLDELQRWNDQEGLGTKINHIHEGGFDLGIITSGVSYMHAREAAPDASVLKLGLTYPLPMQLIADFASYMDRCLIIEEGDPYLAEAVLAAGIAVQHAAPEFRFGELDVARVRRILAGEAEPPATPPAGKAPQLCPSCPHRTVFEILRKLDCIVSGDIGCYTLGVLPPFEAMDTMVCMGAGVTVGLGLRHVLPTDEARRVVGVIGDSTFVHSGITGLVDMVYNPPPTGYVLLILDNDTTAMTGLQEHPGTGRALDHQPTNRLVLEDLCRAIGVRNVHVIDPVKEDLESLLRSSLADRELTVIIVRRPCLLTAKRAKDMTKEQPIARGAANT